MRQFITLIESVQPEYFLHATSRRNLASIRRKGLVANFKGGNYGGGQYESLPGVYLTNDPALISHMVENREDLEDFAVLVIEAFRSELLPDEDFIDIILDKIHGELARKGMTKRALSAAMALAFHEAARLGAEIPYDQKLLRGLITNWFDYRNGIDSENNEWVEFKDQATRKYREMRNPLLGSQNSFRYPATIGFEGPVRIVAIIDVRDDAGKIVYGEVPDAARDLVALLLDDDVAQDLTQAKAELLDMAKRILPDRSEDDLRRQIEEMDAAEVFANIKSAKQRLG